MKYIFTVIICVLCFQSIGQIPDVITTNPVLFKSVIIPGEIKKCGPVTKYDTVKVLMLVTDTSRWEHYEIVGTDSGFYEKKVYGEYKYQICRHMFGYEVRTIIRRNNIEGQIDPYINQGFKYEEWNQYDHLKYLSETYGPLPKNTVVWMAKQITKNKEE